MDGSGDAFIVKFFTRIPAEVAASFTPAQLGAIKLAFGARSWGSHAVDVRKSFTVPLLWRSFYFIFLMGGERRDEARLKAEGALFGTFGNALLTIAFLAVTLGPLALALYVVKSLFGLDVLPGADGFHGLWTELMRQLGFLVR